MGDKVKRLSDAIRLGATIHPQEFHNLFGWESKADPIGMKENFRLKRTCAIGAAIVAIGKAPESLPELQMGDFYGLAKERWPEAHIKEVSCPGEHCQIGGATATIVGHLNDRHLWSREKIADWLEGMGM